MKESRQKRPDNYLHLIPGLLLVLGIAIPATWIHEVYKPISAVAIAIVVGLLWRNLIGLPEKCKTGISFAVKRILRLGIILLGVRLSFLEVVKIGVSSLGIIVTCITLAFLLVHYISRKIGVPHKLGTLIGAGTSICGVSAIVATAPAIQADERDTTFAVATITLFGIAAVIIYPFLGRLLHLSDTAFGIWAGTAVNDTSQVVATGFIYSNAAGAIATVVKLTRNLFMAPVIVIMGYFYALKKIREEEKETQARKKVDWKKTFPLFVLGFLGMAVLRTLGVFPPTLINFIKTIANFLIVVAISGVGLGTSFAMMKKTGLKPFYVGLAASIIMAGVSLTLIKLLNLG